MSSFMERKNARIAAMTAGVRYEFLVVEGRYDGKTVGSFDSRPRAEQFMIGQIGSHVGDTAAYRAWCALQPRNHVLPTSTIFRIERVAHLRDENSHYNDHDLPKHAVPIQSGMLWSLG